MACNADDKHLALAVRPNLGEISLCGCGTIHVSVGSVSIRLAPEAFCELVVMCRSAADALLVEAQAIRSGHGAVVQ